MFAYIHANVHYIMMILTQNITVHLKGMDHPKKIKIIAENVLTLWPSKM